MNKLSLLIGALVLLLLHSQAQTLSSRNIPAGEKIYPTCPWNASQSLFFTMKNGATNSYNPCNTQGIGCISEYADINLSFLNDIFQTSYQQLSQNMIPGRISWEVFNDHSCYSTTCSAGGVCFHKGIDYSANLGTNVFSPFKANGTVTRVYRYTGATDTIITVFYPEYGVTVCFNHLSRCFVTVGQQIQFATQIGNSGVQNGGTPHFHIEVRKGNVTSAGLTNAAMSDSYDPRALYVEANYKKVNDGLDIYAGTLLNPKTLKIFFRDSSLNGAAYNVQNCFLKYYKSGLPSIPIPANAITVATPCSGSNIGRFSIDLSLVNFNITQDTFTKFDIGFQVTHANTTTPLKFFGYQQVYILDPADLTDAATPKWFSKYVTKGVDLGLFRGISKNSFLDTNKPFLTRGQAAKVIVTACEKLGLLSVDVTGNDPPGLKPDSAFYMYMKTLYNTRRSGVPVMSQGYPSDTVTAGQFAKMVVLGFDLSNADINKNLINHGSGVIGEKITVNSYDPSLQQYIDIANKIAVLSDNGNYLEFTATSLSPITSSMISSTNILVNGENKVLRSLMAKYITLTYKYKLGKVTSTSCSPVPQFSIVPPPYHRFTIIGEKYELADYSTGSINLSTGSANIDMEEGEIKDFGLDDETLNGYPLHFYWCVDSGQLVSLFPNNNHKKVRFTAPDVAVPTPVTLYLYIGCGNGMAKEAIYNITVYPTGQVPQPPAAEPTVSPSALGFSNTSYYQTDESWTSGNGDYTLVTYTPQGNTIYPPVDGDVYSPGSTISGNTKVTYNSTGNTDVTGSLQPGTTYQFRAYSFNGNTTGSTNYKTTSPASGSVTTLLVPPFNADFYWDGNPIVAGQPVEFTNTVNGSGVNESWTFQGGSPPASTLNNPDITFASAGTYLVTLTATNTNTNQVSTVSKYVTVLAANAVNPDFVVSNVSLPATTLYAGQGGISTNITFTNIGLINGQVNNYRIYLSSNTVYDAGDTQIGIRQGWASAEIPPGQSLTTTHNISIAGGTATGTWYILVYADFDNTNVEGNEGNNVGSIQVNIQPALPDFVPNTLTLSRNTVATYDTLTITSGIINTGYYQSGYFMVSYYISTNTTFESTDAVLSDCCGLMNAGDCYLTQYNYVSSSRIPATIQSGNYYLIEVVDWYNGAAVPNQYAESNETNNIRYTPITISNPTQPTVAPSNIQVSNITPTSCRISWTNGNGAKRLVVVSQNQTGFDWILPIDKNTYTANSNYLLAGDLAQIAQQANVVYEGNSNFVDVTNLFINTTFTVNVFEFNGSGTSTDYLVTNFLKPVLFKTSDTVQLVSGWRPLTNSGTNFDEFTFTDIQFLNDSVGYACDEAFGILASTKTGGSYWQIERKQNEYFTHLHFISTTIGITAGSDYSSPLIYKTTNGGVTWTKTNFPNVVVSVQEVHMLNSNTWFVVAMGISPDTSGYLYRTIDGGNSFQLLLNTANSLRDIDFVSPTKGFVTGSYRRVFVTNDIGNSWSLIHSASNKRFIEIDFATEQIGYSITVDSIYKTTNGGYNWFPVAKASLNGGDPEHIVFTDESSGYVVIRTGEIVKTIDGGTSWAYLSISPACSSCNGNSATSPISQNKLWVAGDWIYYSETGGLAYSIGKPTLSLNPTCTGFSMQVSFTKTGTFNAGNVFTVQLSDSAGNFNAPLTIGSSAGVNAGTVTLGIPNGVKQSSTYRIRIVSSNPVATSSYSDNLTVYQTPAPSISALLPVQYNLASSPVTLSSYGNPLGGAFTINGSSATTLNPTTLGLGTHTVRYTVVNGSCVSSAEKTITVIPAPLITITQPTPTTVCPGSNITFNYTTESINAGNVFSVQLSDQFGNFTSPTVIYSFTGNNTSGSITAAIPVTAPKAAGYKIRMAASNPPVFSAGSNAFTIDTLLVPAVSVQATATDICAGQAITFSVSTQNAGTTPQYQWLLNNVPIGTNSSTYTNSALNNQDEVSLILTSSGQCALPATVNSTPILIQVNPAVLPAVYIIAEDTVFCEGSPAGFAAYPSNEGNTPIYDWKVNGLATGNNSAYFSSSSLANGDKVSVILTSSEQCLSYATATDSLYTNILPSVTPTISITKDNLDNCSNQLSNFAATFTNAGTNPVFVWKNNGQVVGTNSSTYDNVFLLGGEVITCELTSSLCASPNPILSNTINVLTTNSPAVIGQPQGASTACVGDTLAYTASAGGSTSITWSVTNGTILSGQGTTSVSILWQQDGNNTVTVVGTNTCGSAIANQVKMVNVGAPVDLTIALNNPTVCDDTSAIFSANVTNGGISQIYQWVLNGLTVGSNSGTYTLANPATGDSVVCVLTAANSCSAHPTDTSNTIAVTVIPSPVTPLITMAPAVWCGSNPTYLETQACSGCSYSWSQSFTIPFIGTTVLPISGNTNSIPINGITQGWNVNVTVTNGSGCSASSSTTFNATQYQNSASGISATICQNNPYNFNGVNILAGGVYTDTLTSANDCDSVVTLTLTVNPVSSYLINASICQGASYLFNNQILTAAGTYTDTLSNAQGCDSVIILNLTVGTLPVKPVITIIGDTAFCLGDSVVLQAVNTLDTLLWNTNATTPAITVNNPGFYNVQATNQCGNSISDNLQITVWNHPTQPGIIQNGDTLTSTVAADSYQWYYNQSIASGAITQSIISSQNGNYQVEITDDNGCKNTSAIYNFTSIGITENVNAFTTQIIPNPNTGQFTIQFSDNTPRNISITDVLGRVLAKETVSGTKQITNTNWAEGIYFLNVISFFKTTSLKFVVAR